MHFDEFMDEVHTAIADWRRERPERPDPGSDQAASLETTRLLCLDEFQVTDITNAMLLGRLFERLFAGGVTLVATSNTAPDDLYRDGLNRQLFLPFIELLKSHVEIVPLDGPTDYRRLKFEGEEVYHFGTGAGGRRRDGPALAEADAAACPGSRRPCTRSAATSPCRWPRWVRRGSRSPRSAKRRWARATTSGSRMPTTR